MIPGVDVADVRERPVPTASSKVQGKTLAMRQF